MINRHLILYASAIPLAFLALSRFLIYLNLYSCKHPQIWTKLRIYPFMCSAYDKSHLFPIQHSRIRRGFTTSQSHSSFPSNLTVHPPSDTDKPIQTTRRTAGLTHTTVNAPITNDGTKAWEAIYPEGSINPSSKVRGGFGFYIVGPDGMKWEDVDANEVMTSYAVLFEEGFEFQLGGKLPGLFGGETLETAYGCTGGRSNDRDKCFSLRLMWRENGLGELYAYLPLTDQNDSALLQIPPCSVRNPDYGFSIGRGSWTFTPGKWTVLAIRVKLNDHGADNGEIEVFADGKSVIIATGVTIRQREQTQCRGIHAQTFFGGSSPQWASPKTQRAYFADMSGAILQ